LAGLAAFFLAGLAAFFLAGLAGAFFLGLAGTFFAGLAAFFLADASLHRPVWGLRTRGLPSGVGSHGGLGLGLGGIVLVTHGLFFPGAGIILSER
jgi:hypothetical protein